MQLERGTAVSHYTIMGRLGSGGMGVVYEAEDTKLRRRVAVKFLSEAMQNDAITLERFQREARAASALNHPGICTIHSIEQHEGQHFIVMELIEGKTLSSSMGRNATSVVELLEVGIQIADALESAHSRGIVHRDLKPSNLIVNERGQVKILDFGLAKIEGLGAGDAAADDDVTIDQPAHLTQVGTVLGTVHYMSPEQARGQRTDARTDLFSLGAVLYQMATGELPFQGDTQAVVFESILNRDPRSLSDVNPAMPPALAAIIDKSLEKDRTYRHQSATGLKTDLMRLKRKLDSGQHSQSNPSISRPRSTKKAEKSIAVLYFENLSRDKEDEYLRDGITEDIITDLSKIQSLKINPRSTVLAYRDRPVTSAQVGPQLGAAYVLEGSLRRSGERLRITTQLVDVATGYPIWSERYDRRMKDVFEVQDDIAGKIAEALRIKLSPKEQKAIAAKPTHNLQAYDVYLRGRGYARRLTGPDLELALQMFDDAVAIDPKFTLAHAAIAHVCANFHAHYAQREKRWIERARLAAKRAIALEPKLPEVIVAKGWMLYAQGQYDETVDVVRPVIEVKPDCESAYHLLLCSLYASGRYQEVADVAEAAIATSGEDYNVYIPIMNALGSLGKDTAKKNVYQQAVLAFESHLVRVPEDARARILVACFYAEAGREEDAVREAKFAMMLRPDEASVHYNAACTFCMLGRKDDALSALTNAWNCGFTNADWARRDPDLAPLFDDPEFERMYPKSAD